MTYQLAHYSLRGARPTNQDRTAAADRGNAVIMVLADGLGGHRGGEVAAETLVQTVIRAFQSVKHPEITNPSAFLALTILKAHKAIVERGKTYVPPLEPRTTCVVCLVQNGYAYWAHVGDSRLYHFRNGRLLKRTRDHTTIEQLRGDGLLTEDEMRGHPNKGHLLKCIGGPNAPTVSLGEETVLHRGDVLVLCSDGLWEAFTPEQIGQRVATSPLDEATEEMLLAAERKMGDACDNVSSICFRWEANVTTSLPLQGNPMLQVDQDTVLEGAGRRAGALKAQESEADQTRKNRQSRRSEAIESRIRELEEYLRKFEPPS